MSDGGRRRSGERIRAFLALDPGPEVRAALSHRIDALRELPFAGSIRWVRAENLHLTLRFLGDVEVERLGAIEAAARAAISRSEGFELVLTGVSCFPSKRRPRVVVAEVADHVGLTGLAKWVEQAVVAAGENREPRTLRPHITLGRIRDKLRGPPPVTGPLAGLGFAVRDVVLYQSELQPSGAMYRELARMPLQADPV